MGLRCIPLILIILLAHSASQAQPNRPDYHAEIARATTDTQKLNVYRRVYMYFKDSNIDSTTYYLEQGLKEFTARNYTLGIAAVSGMISGSYGDQGKLKEAEEAGLRALRLYTAMKDEAGVAKSHNAIGVVEGKKGEFSSAIGHFLAALPYFEKVKDTAGIVNTYIKLGTAYDLGGNKDKGLYYNLKGLDLSLKTKQSANTAYFYNNIGSIYGSQHKFDLALIYLKKGLELGSNPLYADARISPLMNIGNIYAERGEWEKAMKNYKEALALARAIGSKDQENKLLQSLGNVESLLKGKTSQPLQDALAMAQETGNRGLQVSIMKDMANVAHGLKNFEEEAMWLRRERMLSDSLFSLEKDKEIANLQSRYELNKSNRELTAIKEAHKVNEQKKQMIVLLAAVLAASLATVLLFLLRSAKLNKKLQLRETELEKANATKDRLFSIIGHDLRGPIASIPALLNIYKSEDTEEDTKKFILNGIEENAEALLETLERLLNWGNLQIKGNVINKTIVSMDETMDNIVRLLSVTAANKNISIVNNLPANVNVYADENHIKFVLRNLVSNAVKFTRSGGVVEIMGEKYSNEYYLFSVRDNGVGMDKEKLEDIFEPYNTSAKGTAAETGTSIGLMLCREFIRLNGGDIWAESETDKGSVFYFTVKAARSERTFLMAKPAEAV